MKECAPELLLVFNDLFNLCLECGQIPNEWKIAQITPVYKGKGNKSLLDNYRPISIISPVSKVFESVMGKKIRDYFEQNNILHQDQNGFREGRSCHLALNRIIDYCKKNLDQKKHVIAVFLDLSKAFDTIDHELLLLKLVKYGFCDKAVILIRNYLEDRFSIVNFDGKASKKEQLHSGVPQGSILGPLLFIIFINDLCYLQTSSSKSLFADDSSLFQAGTNLHSIAESLELDLALVSE